MINKRPETLTGIKNYVNVKMSLKTVRRVPLCPVGNWMDVSVLSACH